MQNAGTDIPIPASPPLSQTKTLTNAEGWKKKPPRRPRRPRRSPTRIEPFVENGRYRSIS
ncbi:hypothetical protein HMPREF0185_02721 [Brevundimonas diminuta 470-4]|nr:hypothetical protein HMPREF0185_02721 [Brevundimonas diminuta 470-4]